MTSPPRRARRLYKDPTDKVIAGVASGVANYFDVDTVLVRAVWFVLAFSGFGLLLYIVLWLVLEDEPAEPPQPREVAPAEPAADDTAFAGDLDVEASETQKPQDEAPGKGESTGR
ncbi:MAG: PspC domain-containing protein [Acidobacteria bacterium]|nr:PspC domain-containing protein [Acidobacteriota bacterium]